VSLFAFCLPAEHRGVQRTRGSDDRTVETYRRRTTPRATIVFPRVRISLPVSSPGLGETIRKGVNRNGIIYARAHGSDRYAEVLDDLSKESRRSLSVPRFNFLDGLDAYLLRFEIRPSAVVSRTTIRRTTRRRGFFFFFFVTKQRSPAAPLKEARKKSTRDWNWGKNVPARCETPQIDSIRDRAISPIELYLPFSLSALPPPAPRCISVLRCEWNPVTTIDSP